MRVIRHDSMRGGASAFVGIGLWLTSITSTLPAEARWEYACRIGSSGAFGDGLSSAVNYTSSWPLGFAVARTGVRCYFPYFRVLM
jgi:formylglycine-generating enzyme required for sulfatase activity